VNPPTQSRKKEPQVGVFWLIDGKPLIDSMPLAEGEPYGDHLTHPRSHYDVWTLFQQKGTVPADVEYEEFPRGRVIYNAKTRRFMVLADRCILKDKGMVTTILSAMNLRSKTTDSGTDSHYRCFLCLERGTA